jgi:uncharacterized protein (DUF169 family)
LALKKEEVPEGIPEIDQKIGHCMIDNPTRKEGRIFFAPSDKHECNGRAWSLGLREITDTLGESGTGPPFFPLAAHHPAV